MCLYLQIIMTRQDRVFGNRELASSIAAGEMAIVHPLHRGLSLLRTLESIQGSKGMAIVTDLLNARTTPFERMILDRRGFSQISVDPQGLRQELVDVLDICLHLPPERQERFIQANP